MLLVIIVFDSLLNVTLWVHLIPVHVGLPGHVGLKIVVIINFLMFVFSGASSSVKECQRKD